MSDELRVLKGGARIRDGNPDPRVPCLLLLDVSSSMSGDKIQELNSGLETLRSELLKDELTARRVEVAVITFGGSVRVVQDFVSPSELKLPSLSAEGDTPMAAAILKAFELVEQRQARYEASDLDSYNPWIFMVTDGEPTDSSELLAKAAQRIRQADGHGRAKRVAFFAVGVDGANMERLTRISKRSPQKLRGLSFVRLFRWVSESLRRVSGSQIGDRVDLPAKDDWAEL
jgi:uncharacterized protein YegL